MPQALYLSASALAKQTAIYQIEELVSWLLRQRKGFDLKQKTRDLDHTGKLRSLLSSGKFR
ncbi:hypothetical protein CKQ84_18245 [Shewanella sp. WE21]|uniref:Uncharacterized protein n=1 Tax=Shewanella oncorhynchi TaxID=2726434 RepID=A0ABX1KK34_9GAMM|nr:hypothetical protein CKQ84_18245 [Shewanella sp. WE21]NLQ22553.1 hypothetical protein [Shewanella oncorhynchi]HAY95288.1 hypothetical protein [Shewanella sp.]